MRGVIVVLCVVCVGNGGGKEREFVQEFGRHVPTSPYVAAYWSKVYTCNVTSTPLLLCWKKGKKKKKIWAYGFCITLDIASGRFMGQAILGGLHNHMSAGHRMPQP